MLTDLGDFLGSGGLSSTLDLTDGVSTDANGFAQIPLFFLVLFAQFKDALGKFLL